MCGIAGIALNPDRTLPDLQESLLAMREAMMHRGPDDAGAYLAAEGRVGLANRRLAIRDLSPAGRMPMSNADGSAWITYNGEIYNTDELRSELERLGFVFHSNSDTEVILHGYEAWGDEVVQRLRGMFAFAILTLEPATLKAQRLFLARDRWASSRCTMPRLMVCSCLPPSLKQCRPRGCIEPGDQPRWIGGLFDVGGCAQSADDLS